MSRTARKQKKVRLSLDLTPDTKEKLGRLRDECDADSYSETVRRALALLETLVRHAKDGGDVVLRMNDDGRPDEKLVIL